jgi:hypothetical protein
VVSVYDPARPWKIGTGPGCNPREIGPIGCGQYRTHAIVLGPDSRVYVGSTPAYSSAPTGAFSRVDPRTGDVRTWLDLVPGGTVDCLAADGSYIYAAGGGKFVVFDPAIEKAVLTLDLQVSALAVTASGQEVVGTGGGGVFVFSPTAKEVTHRGPNALGDFTHLWEIEGRGVYGINPRCIGRIAPAAWRVEQVTDNGGKFLVGDRSNRLYFSRGSRVLRLDLADQPAARAEPAADK